jgi:uncharacterized protein (TIGR02246 family)
MPALEPEEVPRAFGDAFNSGDPDAILALYEPEATLEAQPGQVAAGAAAIRDALGGFLALRGKIEVDLKKVVRAGDLALVSNAWTLAGTGPDGTPVTLAGQTADVVRRQPDGTWRYVIDAPFGLA